ncbi:MAG: glycosyltransferase family 1 protein [Candidatus Hydrogenedentota bacterium]
MIRIGLESTSVCTSSRGGIQHYISSFIESLLANDRIRSDYELRLLYKLSRWRKRQYRYLPTGVRAQWYYERVLPVSKNVDLIHSLDSYSATSRHAKCIGTVYDLAVFKDRLQDERYSPERFRTKKRAKVTATLEVSDAVVTLSESAKKDLQELFGYPGEKIHVIPPGIDSQFLKHDPEDEKASEVLDGYGLTRGGYFLYVGNISFRKNVSNLIQAYADSGAPESVGLVLAGQQSAAANEILDTAHKLDLGDRLKLLGYVPDAVLPALYGGARAFLFPTYYEGFGIPILEAMACRTPVLIGNWGSAPEVANGHATMVDPFEVDSIAGGIAQLLAQTSPAVEEAAQHAARYTWSSCAERTVELYERVLNEK